MLVAEMSEEKKKRELEAREEQLFDNIMAEDGQVRMGKKERRTHSDPQRFPRRFQLMQPNYRGKVYT